MLTTVPLNDFGVAAQKHQISMKFWALKSSNRDLSDPIELGVAE